MQKYFIIIIMAALLPFPTTAAMNPNIANQIAQCQREPDDSMKAHCINAITMELRRQTSLLSSAASRSAHARGVAQKLPGAAAMPEFRMAGESEQAFQRYLMAECQRQSFLAQGTPQYYYRTHLCEIRLLSDRIDTLNMR